MKKGLLFIFLLILTINLRPQKDTANVTEKSSRKGFVREASSLNVNIYPVPVRDNNFSIKSDREISALKITNMIGQDIFRSKYNNPQSYISFEETGQNAQLTINS